VKPPDIPAPDTPQAPARLTTTTALPHAARPEAHNAASNAQKEDVRPDREATDSDDAHGSKISAKERSAEGALERTAVPLYKLNPPPRYPAAARRRSQQGTVVLSVHVDEHGRVSNLWLFESSGYQALDNAAVQAVKDWTFEPGMQGGRNVAMWVTVPVRFELK
jgi:protein TonB